MRALCLAMICLLTSAVASGQAPDRPSDTSSLSKVFETANIAASHGDYATAASNYRRLIRAGVRDPDVYFNLATSFARAGDYPRAILNYERALNLRPKDDKALQDLRSAEKALEELRAEAEGEAMIQRSSSLSDAVYDGFTEDGLAYTLLVANLFFFTGLSLLWVLSTKSRSLYAMLVASGLVLCFAALGLAAKAGAFRDGPRAVALDERLVLREGPDPRAQIRGEARGGDRGEVVGRDRDFVKLRVVSGLEGWSPAASVGLIDLDEGVH